MEIIHKQYNILSRKIGRVEFGGITVYNTNETCNDCDAIANIKVTDFNKILKCFIDLNGSTYNLIRNYKNELTFPYFTKENPLPINQLKNCRCFIFIEKININDPVIVNVDTIKYIGKDKEKSIKKEIKYNSLQRINPHNDKKCFKIPQLICKFDNGVITSSSCSRLQQIEDKIDARLTSYINSYHQDFYPILFSVKDTNNWNLSNYPELKDFYIIDNVIIGNVKANTIELLKHDPNTIFIEGSNIINGCSFF